MPPFYINYKITIMKSNRIVITITVLCIIILFSSCQKRIGYGVILWSSDEEIIKSGSMVNIHAESQIRETYFVTEINSKEMVELDIFRVEFFKNKQNAQNYFEKYSPYSSTFTYSNREGSLPLRSDETTRSEIVYKLRQEQEIKVLGKAEEKVDLSKTLSGYWYQVLTEDGVKGFVFDYYLTVYSLMDSERIIENEKDDSDPILDNFLSTIWRPSYYNNMIVKEVVDLGTFKDSYAFRVNNKKKEITLRTKDRNITKNYTEIIPFGSKRYDFDGTSFRVIIISENQISLQYSVNGKDINEAYIAIEDNVSGIISAEYERRNSLLQEYIDKDAILSSNSYGAISIEKSGNFTWENISALLSQNIISSNSEPFGRIRFNHFLNSSLKNKYAGVISFYFDKGSNISFLYSFTGTGVSFILVPEKYIEKHIVTTDQFYDQKWIYFDFVPSREVQ